ncbi:MAG TPA: hypothetical protein VET88_11795 [Gammaproteobacteria bacterium]|nr:hypothetical protein [Gammaproteobacteria bacterium]
MNTELYNEANRTLNHCLTEDINGEVIEDHVADAAEYHDEQTGYRTNWSDLDMVAEVTRALCNHWNVTFQEEA